MQKKIITTFLITLLFTINVNAELTLNTVEDAYKAIPHERTIYNHKISTLPLAEKTYLKKLFELTDKAVLERVRQLENLRGGTNKTYLNNYDNIIRKIESLSTPASLENVESLILAAILEQREFLKEWRIAKNKKTQFKYPLVRGARLSPLVKQSSAKLKKAYSILVNKYRGETKHNQKSFFNHLCALDFV